MPETVAPILDAPLVPLRWDERQDEVRAHLQHALDQLATRRPLIDARWRYYLGTPEELWMTQQEYYIGKPGQDADMAKMSAKKPDVIAFNGFANQYKDSPITIRRGEKVRMYVLNAGPSIWSAFHVIGTVFDRTVVEGQVGHDAQTINLAPSQGGWVEFSVEEEGTYPFVTHAFGDMVKGALGVLATPHAPMAGSGH